MLAIASLRLCFPGANWLARCRIHHTATVLPSAGCTVRDGDRSRTATVLPAQAVWCVLAIALLRPCFWGADQLARCVVHHTATVLPSAGCTVRDGDRSGTATILPARAARCVLAIASLRPCFQGADRLARCVIHHTAALLPSAGCMVRAGDRFTATALPSAGGTVRDFVYHSVLLT